MVWNTRRFSDGVAAFVGDFPGSEAYSELGSLAAPVATGLRKEVRMKSFRL